MGRMAEEQAEVLAPQGLVDQACEAGEDEDGEEQAGRPSYRQGACPVWIEL